MAGRRWLIVGAVTVAIALLAGRAVSGLVVDHAWFEAMGATSVWWERVVDQMLLQGTAFVIGTVFAFANLYAVRRTILAVAVPSRVANIEFAAMVPSRRLLIITALLAALIGLALAAPLTNWTDVALARHGVPFGESEGILERDLGFYVYWLPFEESMYVWTLGAIVCLTTVVLILYAVTRSLRLDGRRIVASTHVRRHLTVLGTLVLLVLAWSYRLDAFDLLRDGSGPNGLFMRVDHAVTLKADLLLSAVCAIAALLILRAGWMGQVRLAFITLSLVLVAALGLRIVLPALAVRSDVLGDPARREVDYQAMRALFTRRAYDVGGLRTVHPDSVFNTRPRWADLATVTSVWDATTLRQHSAAVGAPPDDTQIGWAATGDGTLVAAVARRSSTTAARWSVSLIDATRPVLRDSTVDLVGTSDNDDADSDDVAVAPGLRGHSMIRDPNNLILGSRLQSVRLRVAHAWATQDPGLLSAGTVADADDVFVSQRDVRARVALLAPIFVQGDAVWPIIFDGALYWAIDLYSASDRYPLSQHVLLAREVRSYFRHAATAVVEARTGHTRLVQVDRPDPLARMWMATAPSLFVRIRDVPSVLADALPPPTDGAIAQLRAFASFGRGAEPLGGRHAADSTLFGDVTPAHLVKSASGPLVAWSAALLDAEEQLSGVLTVVGGRRRGTYWDSTSSPRPRWSAVAERLRVALDSARVVSPEGGRREPRVRASRLQVFMTDNGPTFVQSVHGDRGDGPSIVRVGVLAGDRLGVGTSTADALANLAVRPGTQRGLARQLGVPRDIAIDRFYDAMRQAMRAGDWTKFGAAFDSLGRVLGRPPR